MTTSGKVKEIFLRQQNDMCRRRQFLFPANLNVGYNHAIIVNLQRDEKCLFRVLSTCCLTAFDIADVRLYNDRPFRMFLEKLRVLFRIVFLFNSLTLCSTTTQAKYLYFAKCATEAEIYLISAMLKVFRGLFKYLLALRSFNNKRRPS